MLRVPARTTPTSSLVRASACVAHTFACASVFAGLVDIDDETLTGDLRDQDVDDEDANLLDAEDEELMRHLFENMDEDGGDEDDDHDDSDDEEGDDEGEDDDDDDDDEAAEEEEDIDMQDSRLAWLGIRAGHRFTRQLARFQKLSTCTLESLGHGPAQLVNNSTAAVNARHCQTKAGLSCFDIRTSLAACYVTQMLLLIC